MKTGAIVIILVIMALVAGAGWYLISQGNDTSGSSDSLDNELVVDGNQDGNSNSGTETSSPQTYNIVIENFAFSPSELRIKKGDSIVWTNQDSVRHTVTSDSGNELGSGLLSQGQTYSHTFNTRGTFAYHCAPHPNMKAKIIVE